MRVQLTRAQVHTLARAAQRDAAYQRNRAERRADGMPASVAAMTLVDVDEVEKCARILDDALERRAAA